ncbi:TetR/AcrR family transcriptional regulator [Agarilytica rhodophyticola]|uniref:TetR/AcrR family transcriptional regulator n=1 Tax=Agarilytica rhodophyticola TaxID=1737490 RepID=UPI000B3454E8|nr:TetR/AcrR family transcriptional regulator [Agarilytica rhodophyticola]
MGRTNKRDTLLDTAELLFEKNGFVATGINQITQEAGVAPMTLYNNFANKEELVVATLKRRSERLLSQIEEKIGSCQENPKQCILSIFDIMDTWIREEQGKQTGFAGCTFVKAAIEFGDRSHPSRKTAIDYKRRVIDIFESKAEAMGEGNPRELALKLHLLMEGAITQAQLLDDPESLKRAKDIAEVWLNH